MLRVGDSRIVHKLATLINRWMIVCVVSIVFFLGAFFSRQDRVRDTHPIEQTRLVLFTICNIMAGYFTLFVHSSFSRLFTACIRDVWAKRWAMA